MIKKRIPWNKNKKLSKKHKEKIRKGCKGINLGNQHTLGQVPWNKGKKYKWSKEARKRNKNASYYFKKGNKHPNWKDGISELNNLIRSIEKYKRWRFGVFKKDNFTCVKCGETNCYLEAHHKDPLYKLLRKYKIKTLEQALKCKAIWNIKNGETLCQKCHAPTKGGLFKN